jgi:hypothetical protein
VGVRIRIAAALCLALALGATRAVGEPLDPFDATPRPIRVELETSTNLDVVGATFGAPVDASYAVSGGIGTITIPIASHEQMRDNGGLPPVPGTYTPLVIHIDLSDLSASSESASGTVGVGSLFQSFLMHPLGSDTLAGHFSNQNTPLFCTSQADVDAACQQTPSLCGQTCVIVPGAAYDPVTGKLNMVGAETISGCDGSLCIGPFVFFSQHGDLRFTEAPAPVIPALGASASALLAACLLIAGCVHGRRRCATRPL